MDKRKISAYIVMYNEEKRLKECLSAINFCDEIVAIDLGSTDRTLDIAKVYITQLIRYERPVVLEKLHQLFIPQSKNDLVLLIDPDEILDKNLIIKINECLEKNPDFAIIKVPWHFYFKGKRLKYTYWGDEKNKVLIVNRAKVNFYPRVHRGITLKNFNDKVLTIFGDDGIKHYWADSYAQLFEKHSRYLKLEGQSRYDSGQRYSFFKKIKESVRVFIEEFFIKKGFLGGGREIFLIFFYSCYIYRANNSLKKYEQRQE